MTLHHSISNYKSVWSLHQAFWLTTDFYWLVKLLLRTATTCSVTNLYWIEIHHTILHLNIIICINSYFSFLIWYFSSRLANRNFMNQKANAMIFAWFARVLNILKSCLNRLKIVLNSSAESISEALHFFTRAVQISKVFSLLIWVLTVEFEFCTYYFLVFILDKLWNTFMFNFDLICTDQHIIKLICTKVVHTQH